MKKIVTIFFLFIISIQCLPVKELGKSLFDSSFTEEDCCKKVTDKKCCADLKEFLFIDMAVHFSAAQTSVGISRHTDDILPFPVTDVTTPPPNA